MPCHDFRFSVKPHLVSSPLPASCLFNNVNSILARNLSDFHPNIESFRPSMIMHTSTTTRKLFCQGKYHITLLSLTVLLENCVCNVFLFGLAFKFKKHKEDLKYFTHVSARYPYNLSHLTHAGFKLRTFQSAIQMHLTI